MDGGSSWASLTFATWLQEHSWTSFDRIIFPHIPKSLEKKTGENLTVPLFFYDKMLGLGYSSSNKGHGACERVREFKYSIKWEKKTDKTKFSLSLSCIRVRAHCHSSTSSLFFFFFSFLALAWHGGK